MKQVNRVLSTYTADVSGVCSALYELGGLVVMHDASGCNSTYNTHDEPRWYDRPSMVYISALADTDAIMGADDKLISDITRAAVSLSPRFIAIAGTPIPTLMGTDLSGIAHAIESETGILTFGFMTTGMRSYTSGISLAFEGLARRVCRDVPKKAAKTVNLLGVTPLDFSVNGTVAALRAQFEAHGYEIQSCFAMDSSLDDIERAGGAGINAVLTASGLAAARVLRERFGTPYIVGIPLGGAQADEYFSQLAATLKAGECRIPTAPASDAHGAAIIIGEPVVSAALRDVLTRDLGIERAAAVSPLESDFSGVGEDVRAVWEDELRSLLADAPLVIADPIYRRITPASAQFIELPHEAYSGRIYRSAIPVLTDGKYIAYLEEKIK